MDDSQPCSSNTATQPRQEFLVEPTQSEYGPYIKVDQDKCPEDYSNDPPDLERLVRENPFLSVRQYIEEVVSKASHVEVMLHNSEQGTRVFHGEHDEKHVYFLFNATSGKLVQIRNFGGDSDDFLHFFRYGYIDQDEALDLDY